MPVWTDLIEPAELTGYARAELELLSENSLARWLPNREVPDIYVGFQVGDSGLVAEARYRAYDAEPEIAAGERGEEVTIKIPAISRNEPVAEYHQLRLRNAGDEVLRDYVLRAMRRAVRAIAATSDRQRATVLTTGKATVNQSNFRIDDDFGRDPSLTVTATETWDDPTVDRLADLEAWRDLYSTINDVDPGALVMTRPVFSALSRGEQFATLLPNGAQRPASQAEVNAFVEASGLPPIYLVNRRTAAGPVLPENLLLMLPAPVGPDDYEGTELGATFWGQTLTSLSPEYGIEESEQPGIVVGVHRGEKVPMIAEVIADSISLPVAANANLSLAATVLSGKDPNGS